MPEKTPVLNATVNEKQPPSLWNKFVLLLPKVFKVRAEFMSDTEENVWGHFLLSNFWSHEEIGCSLQKAVKACMRIRTHTHTQV